MKLAYVENETSKATYVGEGNSSPSNVRHLSRDSVKNDRRDTQADRAANYSRTSCWSCDDPILIAPSWFSAAPGLTLAGPDYWRNEILFRGPRRALRNTTTWPFQNLRNTCESKKFVDPKSSSATTSMTFGTQVCAQ